MTFANDNAPKAPVLEIPELSPADVARFWSAVDRSAGEDACWPFQGATSKFGYGRFKIGGKLYSAHRVAFTIAKGPITNVAEPNGTVIRHDCDNPPCCNPGHLLPGTNLQNVLDMMARGRNFIARGEFNGMAVANDNIAKAVRESALSSRKAAAEFGISRRLVRDIREGRRWAHVA